MKTFILTIIISFYILGKSIAGSIIVHGPGPLFKKEDTEWTNRVIKLKFNDNNIASFTLHALNDKDDLIDKFTVKNNHILYRSRRFLSRTNRHILSTTSTFACDILDQAMTKKTIPKLYNLINPIDKKNIRDFEISNNLNKIVYTQENKFSYKGSMLTSYSIWIYDKKDDAMSLIVPPGYVCEKPVFSPDDKKIAFYRAPMDIWSVPDSSFNKDVYGHVLCLIDADGTNLRVMSPPANTLHPFLPSSPAWSPDGNKILFVSQYNSPSANENSSPGIYITDIRKNGIQRLSPAGPGKAANFPSWAPDGNRFCYSMLGKLIVHDCLSNQDSEFKTDKSCSHCTWAPDGDLIAFAETDTNAAAFKYLSIISAAGNINLKHITPINILGHQIYWMK